MQIGCTGRSLKDFEFDNKYLNIRGTQFRKDDVFGPRCNPIEDLVRVSFFLHIPIKNYLSFIVALRTLSFAKESRS